MQMYMYVSRQSRCTCMCRVSPLHVVICDDKTPYQLFTACTLEHREPLLLRAHSSLGSSRDERQEQSRAAAAGDNGRARHGSNEFRPSGVGDVLSRADHFHSFFSPASRQCRRRSSHQSSNLHRRRRHAHHKCKPTPSFSFTSMLPSRTTKRRWASFGMLWRRFARVST